MTLVDEADSSKDESMNEQDFYSFKDNSVSVNYSADTPHLYCSVIELHAVIETEDAQHQTQAVFCQNSTAAPISETTVTFSVTVTSLVESAGISHAAFTHAKLMGTSGSLLIKKFVVLQCNVHNFDQN